MDTVCLIIFDIRGNESGDENRQTEIEVRSAPLFASFHVVY